MSSSRSRANEADGAPRASQARSLQRLRELLLAEGGLMASLIGPAADGGGAVDGDAVEDRGAEGDAALEGPARLAASGPRAEGRREEYELLVEAIYEGYLLHYYAPRLVRPPGEDLGVLAGDRLYALGLDRLVRLGDMDAVAELADVITLTALAQADGRQELAEAIWQAGARAVGWGPSAEYERAKALARSGSEDALDALRLLAAG